MKELLARFPYLVCGLGQIRHQKPLRGWVLAIAFSDCVAITFYFLFFVDRHVGIPIGLLCLLLSGLLWFYSYLDYLELAPAAAGDAAGQKPGADYYESGRISFLRGELADARLHFQKALKKNREDWDALYQLARVQLELGEKQKARKLFERYSAGNESRKWQREVEEYLNEIQNRPGTN